MNKVVTALCCLIMACSAQAQGLGGLLKGLGDGTSTIGNIIEGVFTKSDLTVGDIAGEYEATAPAVAFKGDNFLKKAGGIAAAGALETKLTPYYKQYGLLGMKLAVKEDSTFVMTVKGIKLMGSLRPNKGEGTFTFDIKVGQKLKLGQFTAYIEKTGDNLNMMFDATKLKELVSSITKVSGMKMAGAMGSLLDSYDGACIGFKLKCTAKPEKKDDAAKTGTVSGTGAVVKGVFDAIKKRN